MEDSATLNSFTHTMYIDMNDWHSSLLVRPTVP